MCLCLGRNIALVAKKDIIVYKQLKREKNGKLVTPTMNYPVTLNSIIKPENKDYEPSQCLKKWFLRDGVIHAYLSLNNGDDKLSENEYIFKAIIKEGTKYYIGDEFSTIAAEEVYVTDEQVTSSFKSPDLDFVCRDYIETVYADKELFNKDGIGIGYVRLSDGTFASPLENFDNSKAIGVVAFFRNDGTPVIVALDNGWTSWTDIDIHLKYAENDNINHECGRTYTYNITPKAELNLLTIDFCKEYKTDGTEKGEWYLGCSSEMIKVIVNMVVINASMVLNNIGTPMDCSTYWVSTESIAHRSDVGFFCFGNTCDFLPTTNPQFCCNVRPLYY